MEVAELHRSWRSFLEDVSVTSSVISMSLGSFPSQVDLCRWKQNSACEGHSENNRKILDSPGDAFLTSLR